MILGSLLTNHVAAAPLTHTAPQTRQASPTEIKIQNLDLEPIKYKLVKEHGWSLAKVDKVEKLYKTYLLLFVLYPDEQHVPTHEIDEMWHTHILDTRKYMADCHAIFGYYLHHYPYLGLMGTEDKQMAEEKFTATRRFFIALSGTDPLEHGAADCGGCSGGSSCSSSSCSSGDSTPSSDIMPAIIPLITSCSSSDSRGPLKDSWDKKKDRKPANDSGVQEKKKPLWRRIIGMLDRNSGAADEWQQSVTPQHDGSRPTRDDLIALAATRTRNSKSVH